MKRISRYLSVLIATLVLALNVAPVEAASGKVGGQPPALTPQQQTSSGLSITPRKNYVVEPGKTVTDKLKITNLDRNRALVVSMKAIDFTFTDESGTPKLLLDTKAPPTTWSLKPFLKLPDSVTIPAGGSKQVDMTITIPKDQGAGSYYSALEYSAAGTNGGNVSLSASGVTLAFLSVPGVVNEKMTLTKLGAFQPDKSNSSGKYIFIATKNVPDAIAYALKNEGNVAENPAGTIVIKNMFNKVVKTMPNANPKGNLALIGQTRRFEACFNPTTKKIETQDGATTQETVCNPHKMWPGRYTIELDSFFGQNGNKTHEVTGVATFWYLPIWFLVAIAAVLLLIAYVVWKIKRKLNGKGESKGFSFKRNKNR